jgi:hypothetical protein
MLRLTLVVGCLVASLLSATATHAQVISPDFSDQLQPTLPANQDLLDQILQLLPATDLAAITDQSGSTLSAATDLEQQLNQLLANAPDDPARSRLEGVLTHVQASVAALNLVQTETSLDSARARLDQARGEANEALSELQPFVMSIPPAEVPTTGK